MSSEHYRASMHVERLKHGGRIDPTKPTLKEKIRDTAVQREAAKEHIKDAGIRLTYAQERALCALQRLFDDTDYKGNSVPKSPSTVKRYKMDEPLPVLEIKTSEYLRAYGVRRHKTARGLELSPQARRVAIEALKDLAEQKHLLVYDKSSARTKGKVRKVRIEAVAPLLKLEWLNKGRRIRIVPNPVLVDQIDSYFVLKPADLFDRLDRKDAVEVRFVNYLHTIAEQIRRKRAQGNEDPWEIRLTSDVMALTVGLDAKLRHRRKAEVRKKLEDLYERGVKMGLITSYQRDVPGTKRRKVDVLTLNPDGFGFPVPDGAESTTT